MEHAPTTAASDELLRLIVDSATDFAIFTIDPHGATTSWNSGAQRLLGYTEAEILSHSADVIFPPEEGGVAAAEEERRTALAQGRAEDERWQLRKDGTRFFASGLLLPLADRGQGFVKILRDRTRRHELEDRVRDSEELFRLLATNIPQLVFRSKASGERTWPSPQWCAYTGMSFEQSLHFGWLEAIHPEDRRISEQAWLDARARGEYYVEHRIRRATDAEFRWHQTRAAPLNAGQFADWVGTSSDIYDLRTLQDEQQVLLGELQHRTRNLLAVVQAIAKQMLRSSISLEQFGAAFESRLRALSRVQALLARAGQESLDVRELVETELHAHGWEGGETAVTLQGPACVLPVSAAQPVALALHELATNATKYGAFAHEGAKLLVSWAEDGSARPTRVVLRWQETGVPMVHSTAPRRGFGSDLIQRALPYQLGARTRLEFGESGVTCEISVPLRAESSGEAPGA
ncbi:MAG TPA: PAS domain S-box protein [Steroidobacteraceae bacterium]|nr:PAS domain S-box protein [Steroidobacteraceae bacterium]